MRKKLFAVIMSVMMMVTFMPAMAFAAGTCTHDTLKVQDSSIVWADDYQSVSFNLVCTNTDCLQTWACNDVKPTFTWDKETGVITAKVLKGSVGAKEGNDVTASFIDVTGAKLVGGVFKSGIQADKYLEAAGQLKEEKAYWTTDSDSTLLEGVKLELVQPSYVQGYDATKVATADADGEDLAGLASQHDAYFDIKVYPSDYEGYGDDGNYEFPVQISKHVVNCTKNASSFKPEEIYGIIGSVDTTQNIAISLKKTDANPLTHVTYSIDGNNEVNELLGDYDNPDYLGEIKDDKAGVDTNIVVPYIGADQNFHVTSTGLKIEYGVVGEDGQTTWSETAPEIKDVKETVQKERYKEGYNFKVRVTKEKTPSFNSVSKEFTVNVEVQPVDLELGFNQEEFHYGLGEKINKADLISGKILPINIPQDYQDTLLLVKDVYAADKAMFDKCVDELIDVNGISEKLGVTTLTMSINPEVYTKFVSDKEFKQFALNYGLPVETNALQGSARLAQLGLYPTAKLIITNKVNDVTAPNQTKTYHVKNAKALKKNQKAFQLKASADWGTLSFTKMSGNSKIKVAADGKVTVKKGLKKGRYVVRVKVKAPNAKAIKRLVVKVVK